MMKYKIALFAIILLALNACSTTYYSKRSIGIDSNDVLTNDVVVDVKCDVGKNVSATSTERETVDLAKNEAYYKAITENNIDLIIDPIFEIKTTGRKSIVKVTGFAGYYANPRTKTEAVMELQSLTMENFVAYERMYYPDLVENKHHAIEKLSGGPSVKVLNTGMKFLKPVASVNPFSKKMEFSLYNCRNVFSTEFDDFDNNGNAVSVSYDFNPNRKVGFVSEVQYSFNSDYDHISKTLYLRYSMFPKVNIVVGPSILYFWDNAGLNPFNLGYTAGAAYNFGKKLSFKVRTLQFANVSSDADIDVSYTSLSFGVGYKF